MLPKVLSHGGYFLQSWDLSPILVVGIHPRVIGVKSSHQGRTGRVAPRACTVIFFESHRFITKSIQIRRQGLTVPPSGSTQSFKSSIEMNKTFGWRTICSVLFLPEHPINRNVRNKRKPATKVLLKKEKPTRLIFLSTISLSCVIVNRNFLTSSPYRK